MRILSRSGPWVASALVLVVAVASACSDSSAPDASNDDAPPASSSGAPSSSGSTSSGSPGSPDDAATPDAGPGPDLGPGGDFKTYADRVAARLAAFYDSSTGLFSTTGWWNSANAITALVDYSAATGSTAYRGFLSTTFDKNSSKSFLNDYYDDEGWWALAWIDAFDLTSEARYLEMAKTIFADMKGGWDATCGGGIWWRKERDYKNAIANELFLTVAIRLHQRTPNDAGAGSFLDWAQKEWSWFSSSTMINAQNLVNDGLNACKNNNGQTWTYNQGVVLGGLVDLAAATKDATYLTRATAIADAAIAKLVDAHGVLHEPCEPSCGGDGSQFKGIFMRNLAKLAAASSDPRYRVFLATNADWIWNGARANDDSVGLAWTGVFDSADASRQSSALDALNAAVKYSDPQPNLAKGKTASANGSCAADETADKAVDGTTTTKWCSGATNGKYWLEVDLGADQDVGRVIVRHAQAGGEKAAWNTRDFTVSIAGATAATTTGNTLPVTIHRVPVQSTRKVRIDITAPQTDPSTVAARLYEVEVYGR